MHTHGFCPTVIQSHLPYCCSSCSSCSSCSRSQRWSPTTSCRTSLPLRTWSSRCVVHHIRPFRPNASSLLTPTSTPHPRSARIFAASLECHLPHPSSVTYRIPRVSLTPSLECQLPHPSIVTYPIPQLSLTASLDCQLPHPLIVTYRIPQLSLAASSQPVVQSLCHLQLPVCRRSVRAWCPRP